jgi:hypothetical protein
MGSQEKAELVEIPPNWVEKLFPNSRGSVQELRAHKTPYQRPSAHETAALAYLRRTFPPAQTSIPLPSRCLRPRSSWRSSRHCAMHLLRLYTGQFAARTSRATRHLPPVDYFILGRAPPRPGGPPALGFCGPRPRDSDSAKHVGLAWTPDSGSNLGYALVFQPPRVPRKRS